MNKQDIFCVKKLDERSDFILDKLIELCRMQSEMMAAIAKNEKIQDKKILDFIRVSSGSIDNIETLIKSLDKAKNLIRSGNVRNIDAVYKALKSQEKKDETNG